jgi:hypothetical protein
MAISEKSLVAIRSFHRREKRVMSSTGTVNGFLTIEPPLKWSEIRESPFFVNNQSKPSEDTDVILYVEEEETETEAGRSVVITSSVAIPCRPAFDCRALEEWTKLFVKAMKAIGRSVCGVMIVQPRDFGDGGVWRVIVDGGGVRKEDAKYMWPDGSEVELP